MTFVKSLSGAAAFIAVLAIGCGLSAPSARAGYIVTLLQEGPNVVASGSGAIDLTGLAPSATFLSGALLTPSFGAILTGPTSALLNTYTGLTGPRSFGSGNTTIAADSGMGALVGVDGFPGSLFVPAGYVSDTPLSDSSTYDNQTFASLGVTPGLYEWTWGPNQNFTLDVVAAAVGEPASLALLALPLGLVAMAAVRRKPTLKRGAVT